MTVEMHSYVAAGPDTARVLTELAGQMGEMDPLPQLAFVFYSFRHDDAAMTEFFQQYLPGVPLIGGTSSHGLVDRSGLRGGDPIGLLTITDADGSYGVGAAALGDDPAAAGEAALLQALDAADAAGELPELVWLFQTMGHEEEVLTGIKRVVGDRCPIVGGTAIDDDIAGQWRLLGTAGTMRAGVVVAALFPSGGVSVTYQGGYEPTGAGGVVTEVGEPITADGTSRLIVSIDGRPAAEVYDEWRGGILREGWRRTGQVIQSATAAAPLGVEVGVADGVSYFQLVHPAEVTASGELIVFTGVRAGTRLYVMRGSTEGLIRRVGLVVGTALAALGDSGPEVAGGLVIYCAGCRLAVGGAIDRVVAEFTDGFDGHPFLGAFTGGEQGPILGCAYHANLMISAVVFGNS